MSHEYALKPHVSSSLDKELVHVLDIDDPRDTRISRASLAEDMAFAATSAAFFMACNTVAPVVGGIAAAAVIPAAARALDRDRDVRRGPRAPKPHVEEAVAFTCAVERLEPVGLGEADDAASAGYAAWNAWLPWGRLHAGEKVEVPAELAHPKEVGFRYTRLASNVGQVGDWVRSLADGSRLHVHEYAAPERGPGRRFVIHRDALDPSQGPVTATFHWMSETPEGNMLGAVLTATTFFCIWKFAEP